MARDFTSGNLSGGDVTFLDVVDGWSWHGWVYLDALGADQIIWEKADSAFGGLVLFCDVSGPNATNTYELYQNNTNRIASSVSNTAIAGQWQSIGIRFKTGAGNCELFVDGVSIGTDTFAVNPNNGESLLFGMHSNSGDRRYLNGKESFFTFWSAYLGTADFVDLAAGKTPTAVHAKSILRHWDITGDSSPEPESIVGTDTLAVTSAVQSADPSLTLPVLTTPLEADITETTATISAVSDSDGGTLHAYVSTSATAPSVTDLKAGTGAVFKTSDTTNPPRQYPFVKEMAADVGAVQAAAFDGAFFFTSAGVAGDNKLIYTYNSDFSSLLKTYDTAILISNAHTQCNGMFIVGTKIYVTANNFPTTPSLGWVFVFDINQTTGELTSNTTHSLSNGGHAEAPAYHNGSWWICGHDYHGLDEYDASFGFVARHNFPIGTDPGTARWQGLLWDDNDYVTVNVHNENANAPRLDVYEWSGTAFSTIEIGLPPPTPQCTQGMVRYGADVYWAERVSLSRGDVIKSSILVSAQSGANEFNVTGLATSTTTYYTYFLLDVGTGNSIDSVILESGIWSSAGSTARLPIDLELALDPGLYIPGRKPIVPVEIDWEHPLTHDLSRSAVNDGDLVSGSRATTYGAFEESAALGDLGTKNLQYSLGTTRKTHAWDGYLGASQLSITIVFNQLITKAWAGIIGAKGGSNSYSTSIAAGAGNNRLYFFAANGANSHMYTANNTIVNNEKTTVTMVFDGTQAIASDRIKAYVNGKSVALTVGGSPGSTLHSDATNPWTTFSYESYSSAAMYLYVEHCHLAALSESEVIRLHDDPYQFLRVIG